ncbi:target of rapamycin complex subunit lst8-like [Mercenaria mercenaria]|uniref:target of rapamycin complex subunit lst8-like n=1 Tax=Mercenaria mercenaria TaxID=6596 RepID=UPI00234E4EC6|nr:target of rapamycin complex subunit lst8-like [Mercenaria mercenaria]
MPIMSTGGDNTCDPVILATAGYDHTIRFWQAHSGICYRTVQHPDSQVNALEITPDKQLIAAAGFTKRESGCKLWGNNSAKGFGSEFCIGTDDIILRLQFQGELFIGDQSGSIHIWDLKTDKNEQLIPETDASIQSISIDAMGTMMAAVTNKGKCHIWTLTGGRREEPTQLHPKSDITVSNRYALKCLFSPDSTLLATTLADNSAKIWKTADLTLHTELKENSQRWVWDCAFSGDSQYIITASSDNMARLWSVDTGEVKKEYSGHQKAVVCLAFRDESIQ